MSAQHHHARKRDGVHPMRLSWVMEKSMQLLPMLRMMLNRSTSLMVFLTTMSDAMKGTKKGKVLTSLLTDQESCPLTNGSVSSPLQANLVCSSAIILRLAENGKVITLSLISKISSAMPREPVFKRIYCSPKEQWTFPMRAIYDKRSRTVCVDDPAMLKGSSKDGNELFQEPGIDDDRALFEFDAGRSMTEEEIAIARDAEARAEASHGGGADYWERKIDENKWIYHVIVRP